MNEQEEEQRELRLHAFAGAGAQRHPEPEAAEPDRDQDREHEDHERSRRAGDEAHAGDEPDRQVEHRLHHAEPDGAADLAEQERRVAHGRQREPVQEAGVDVAREVDACDARREERALHERERQEEREERPRREPGQVRRRAQAVRVDGHQHQREGQRRDPHAGLAERANHRPPRDQEDLPCGDDHSSSEPSSVRPVFARKTSSSVGWCRLISAARTFSWSSARITSGSAPGASSCTACAPGRAAVSPPKRRQEPGQPLAVVRILRHDLDGRLADLGLQLRGRALGDDLAVVDDPDPVGEHVRLLEVLRRQEDGDALVAREAPDLLPERRAALRVEPGGRLVEEEDRRVVDQRERQVEPALHPARVRADLAVAGARSGRRGRAACRSAPCARSPRIPCSDACRRRCSRPRQERVERRLLQRGADRGAHLRRPRAATS